MEQGTRRGAGSNMSVTIIDPLIGSPVALPFVPMRLHPFDIIHEQPAVYADDKDAIVTSQLFQGRFRQGGVPPPFSSLRSNTTNIEATDLFDPEILSLRNYVMMDPKRKESATMYSTPATWLLHSTPHHTTPRDDGKSRKKLISRMLYEITLNLWVKWYAAGGFDMLLLSKTTCEVSSWL
jgi:hypothetical protein